MKMSLLRSVSCPAPLYAELHARSPAELAEQRGREPKGSCCPGPCQGAGGTGETGLLEWEEQQPQAGRQLQLSRGRGEQRILEAMPTPMWKANNQVNKDTSGWQSSFSGGTTGPPRSGETSSWLWDWAKCHLPELWCSPCWKAGRAAVTRPSCQCLWIAVVIA